MASGLNRLLSPGDGIATGGESFRLAVTLLTRARSYACVLGCDVWEFAIEIACLRRLGLGATELCWLVRQGYVAHALELTASLDGRRTFEDKGKARLSAGSCIILTEAGTAFGRQLQQGAARVDETAIQQFLRQHCAAGKLLTPYWNASERELTLARLLIKEFNQPAPSQEAILAALQEEGWPLYIFDPLPPVNGIDPKRHLHDTINNLNRHQRHHLLQFFGDGTGTRVGWRLLLGC
jgi:hypothetical protein